ncbi:SpdD protein [Streptomyces avermitilis]|uniref:SpdD protein n=1 Tax=Streptomyces avermitilis TaxID=33903 RepID=UPI0036AC570B
MFRPKLPDAPPLPTVITQQHSSPAPVAPAGRPVTPYVGVGISVVGAVVVVGVVLTALLAAVAISAVSVAIAAVVLRSLVSNTNKR